MLDLKLFVVHRLEFQIALESLEVLNLTRSSIRKVSLHISILTSSSQKIFESKSIFFLAEISKESQRSADSTNDK